MPKTLEDLRARDMLTLDDVAGYLGVCRETARRLVHKPGFPLFVYERTFRVPREAFLRWLEREAGAVGAVSE